MFLNYFVISFDNFKSKHMCFRCLKKHIGDTSQWDISPKHQNLFWGYILFNDLLHLIKTIDNMKKKFWQLKIKEIELYIKGEEDILFLVWHLCWHDIFLCARYLMN